MVQRYKLGEHQWNNSVKKGEFYAISQNKQGNDEEFEFVRDEPPSGLYKKMWNGGFAALFNLKKERVK